MRQRWQKFRNWARLKFARWGRAILFPGRVRLAVGPGGQRWRFRLACWAHLNARGNVIVCGRNVRVGRLRVLMHGRRNRLEIGDGARLAGVISINGDGVTVRLGDGFDAKGVKLVAWSADIEFGPDCLLSEGIEVRSGDIHRIEDAATGEILNPAARVDIGARVWIGAHATILKGAAIADDSIVGTRAVVTGRFETPGAALAGVPARIIRQGVRWRR